MKRRSYYAIYILLVVIPQHCQALFENKKYAEYNPKIFIWSKKLMEFKNSRNQSFSEYYFDALKPSIYDLRNVTVRVLAQSNMEPYIISSENKSEISGFLGDLWYILEEYLKFRSDITSISDFDEGFGMVAKNESDVLLSAAVHYGNWTGGVAFSQPYFFTWYHLYFKLPDGKPPAYIHFKVFTTELWVQILLLYLFSTLALWCTCSILKKVSNKGEIRFSPLTYFISLISSFLNTGYDLRLRSYSGRIQIFSALVFGLLSYNALSATLVARLAVLDRPMPFESLNDMTEKKTHILCVKNISFTYNNFTDEHKVILPQWQGLLNTKECPKKNEWREIVDIICKDNMVFLENRIVMALVENHKNLSCDITYLPEQYFGTGLYITFNQGFQGRRAIKLWITKMKSAGILGKLEHKWVPTYSPKHLSPVKQITFNHVKGLIWIYLYMALFSFFVLILEIVYERFCRTDGKGPRNIKHAEIHPFLH